MRRFIHLVILHLLCSDAMFLVQVTVRMLIQMNPPLRVYTPPPLRRSDPSEVGDALHGSGLVTI